MSKGNPHHHTQWPEPSPPTEIYPNHVKSQTPPPHTQWPEPSPPPEIYQYGYPPSSRNPPFLGTYNNSGLYTRTYGDMGDNYHRIQVNAGTSRDPRLLMLLEFFRELHIRRNEVLKRLFPDASLDALVEIFKKIDDMLHLGKSDHNIKARTLQRSLSVGSPRPRSIDESELRLDRFKIRTVFPGGGTQGGDQSDDDSDTKGGGSGSNISK